MGKYDMGKDARIVEWWGKQEIPTISQCATSLGIDRDTVRRALERHKIEWGRTDCRPTNARGKGEVGNKPRIVLSQDNGDADKKRILELLKKKPYSIGELSRQVDRSKETIFKILQELRDEGLDIDVEQASKQAVLERVPTKVFKSLDIKIIYKKTLKFLVAGDTQFCSKYQQMKLLHTAYDIAGKEQCAFALNPGDLVDGMGVYRGQQSEVFLHDADDQREYAIEHYPKIKGMKTYIIAGNHDLIFKKRTGYNILRHICERRDDLVYRGEVEADFTIKDLKLCMLHPSGGVAYARSYRPQKIAESIISQAVAVSKRKKGVQIPHILIIGHYHYDLFFSYGGMEVISSPCFQTQTPYLKTKALAPSIGFIIVEVTFDDKGNVIKIVPDFYRMDAYVREHDY